MIRIPVKIGEVIHLQEADYCYGLGVLSLRVTKVERLSDPDWVDLEGIQIGWNGEAWGRRHARVRLSALRDPRSRRKP